MPKQRLSVLIFGVSQAAFLGAVLYYLFWYRRRLKETEAAETGMHLSDIDLADSLRRTRVGVPNPGGQQKASEGAAESARRSPQNKTEQLSSGLPSWEPGTPPHVILGVRSDATREQIDKKLLSTSSDILLDDRDGHGHSWAL